jgi:acetyltransferase
VRTEAASSWDEVEAAAHRIGYPVALKTASLQIQHKTEADGVRVNICDVVQLRSGYDDRDRSGLWSRSLLWHRRGSRSRWAS